MARTTSQYEQRFKKERIWLLGLALVLLTSAVAAFARAPIESEFVAAATIAEEVSHWISGMERIPRSISIFSVYSNYPLEQDYSNILETELLKQLAARGLEKVTACTECRAPQVMVQDEKLIIRKGTPDLEALKRIGAKQPVETFLTVDVYRTKLSIIAQVVLYQNPTGVVLAADRFRVPTLNLTDAATHLSLVLSIAKALSTVDSTTFSLGFDLMLLEEMGFGKGGLDIGLFMGGTAGTLFYLNPTLAFFGRFGSSALGYSLDLGMGYGFAGALKGITLRGAYQLYLGSLTQFGVVGGYFLPLDSGTNTLNGFIGFNLGIYFGR